jgi:DNA-binding transcriptional regulator GbsR (MarR family)
LRISLISSKLLVLVLGLSLLFANISITPASAEINDLTATETANIQLVIDNINELISSLEQIRDNGSSRERKIAERLIAEYVPIRANIESKLGDEIKSVPELDDGNPPRYRHGEHNGSPKGAYCGDNQSQIRNDDGTWVPCPQGIIILDSDLLDPGNGTPIDESTTEGWQDKWELADIIVHEKYHEKFIDREVQTLQERAWWNNLTPEQKEQRIQEAIERATTARKHAGVFMAQKDFVSMHKELLEEQKDELKDEKKDLQSERRTLQRSDGNDVRINEINQRLEEIEQRLEDIDDQTDWLKDRRKALERTARNAVAGSHFGFEDCSWPHNHSTGNVAMMITFPAGLERIDFKVLENQITDVRITDTIWYDEYEQIESKLWEPSLYMEMTEPVFSSTIFQPNVCDYIDKMLETGEIKASTEPLPIFETYTDPFPSETPSIPTWIKTNALWWSENQIDDKTFALAIGHLVKTDVIKLGPEFKTSSGDLVVSENLSLPSWIKNNAGWWGTGEITDNDFKQGIQFMLNEEIISFNPKKSKVLSCSEDTFCKPLIDMLKEQIPIPESSHVFYAKAEPGTILREDFEWENQISLEIPKNDGEYYAFYIDYTPGAKFAHTVTYAWIDLQSLNFDYVYADWPPVIEYGNDVLSYMPKSDFVEIDNVIFQPETWHVQEGKDKDVKREPAYDVSHKPIATGPGPKSIKPYQKVALLIDLGDNPPRHFFSPDVAKAMAKDADDIKKYLDDNGYQTNRVSNYHGNDYPRVDSASDVRKLLESYSKAFDPDVPCGHEFFLFLDGHGSEPFFSEKLEDIVGSSLSIYKADGSGKPDEGGLILDSSINSILKNFEPCVKIIVFIDSCYGGSMIQDSFEILEGSCENKPCGMTIMAGNSKRESTYVFDGGPTKFLAGSDKDHDKDGVKGDLRDMFEEMKRLQKQDKRKSYGDENPYMDDGMDAQLFICTPNQPLCSLDGPVRIGINDNVRGVHIAPESTTVSLPSYDPAHEWLEHGNGTITKIPDSFPPLSTRIGVYEVPVPADSSLLPGSKTYNELEPDISSNNASWLGEKKVDELFSISDVTFWVETPKLPTGYFYTGKLYPALSVEGPLSAKGYSDIVSTGDGTYKGSFTFECYYEGSAQVVQLVSLYWQLWKGDNPNNLSSATKITGGIVSSDRESRLNCVGEDEGSLIDPETTDYYYGWDVDTTIIIEEPDYTIPNDDLVETDSDNDGINDNKDSCPNEPETVNDYEDLDGCPDNPPTADTTPPTITVPQNIVTESEGESTPVSFTVTANDNVDGNIAVSCDPSSGTIFPVGTTQVTCTATDSSDNTSQESFTVTVLSPESVDSTPPVISVPSNTIIESSEELTPVTFDVISNDNVDGSITPTCNPTSGSLFPVGTTTVTCTATDSAGNTATKSFTVEIIFVDIKSPEITISSINSVESGDGFIVTYDATAEDNVDGSVEVTCNPPSGSFFPVGTHRITCTATDSAGNTSTKSIDVTVSRVE